MFGSFFGSNLIDFWCCCYCCCSNGFLVGQAFLFLSLIPNYLNRCEVLITHMYNIWVHRCTWHGLFLYCWMPWKGAGTSGNHISGLIVRLYRHANLCILKKKKGFFCTWFDCRTRIDKYKTSRKTLSFDYYRNFSMIFFLRTNASGIG